ncbi:hypothetical protein GCM10027159_08290 [Lysobacter terrae]
MLHIPEVDEILLNAVLRVAHEEGSHREWKDLEPALAATWERMRSPSAPNWEEVAERVHGAISEQAPAAPTPSPPHRR